MKPQVTKTFNIVAVLFIVVVGAYFVMKMRSGGKRASSFVSLTYKWGVGDTLKNAYDSKTGAYQFVDQRDQLIKEKFRIRTNNVIYLHSKINEQDLLNIPDTIANPHSNLTDPKVLRYEFKFIYDDSVKNIIYLTNYDGDPVIKSRASELQRLVQQMVNEAEERFSGK